MMSGLLVKTVVYLGMGMVAQDVATMLGGRDVQVMTVSGDAVVPLVPPFCYSFESHVVGRGVGVAALPVRGGGVTARASEVFDRSKDSARGHFEAMLLIVGADAAAGDEIRALLARAFSFKFFC